MSSLKTLVLLCCLPACGRQIVEFGEAIVDADTVRDALAHDAALHDAELFDAVFGPDAALGQDAAIGQDAMLGIDALVGIDAGPGLDAVVGLDASLGLDAGLDASLDASLDATLNPDAGPCTQQPVALGAAAGFAVLAGSTVTNTGATMVIGDLGVSPGTAVTGFPPGILVGALHAGDPSAATAIGDLTTAYNDAAGRTLCAVSVSGDLGGMTLTPGLYKSTSGLGVTSADLTLDGQGNSSAVFIFEMASTLTVTVGRHVTLINGASASNIFWQVGTSATFGTTTVFQGTVMADQAITLGTGATLNGRALARIAAVALDTNTITKM